MSSSKKDFIKLVFGEEAVENLSESISEDWEIKEFFDLFFGEWKKEIPAKQDWKGIKIEWDPDSSPEAWEHYKKYYTPAHWALLKRYGGKDLADSEPLGVGKGGLYAPQIEVGCPYVKECDKPCSTRKKKGKKLLLRLRGETDFNFKGGKYNFEKTLKNTPPESCSLQNALILLEKCKEMHHSLLNFSLLQSVGAMQLFKGRWNDRLDKFIYHLDCFYKKAKNQRKDDPIIEAASKANRDCLMQYLASFTDVYDYCDKVYFIQIEDNEKSNNNFIQRLIESGKGELSSGDEVLEYMKLAIEFWDRKRRYFEDEKQS